MADKTFVEEEDQIDLDVSFNEFEDEFLEEAQSNIKPVCKGSSNDSVDTKYSAENLTEYGEGAVKSEASNHCDKDVEEGELSSHDEEMELLIGAIKDDTVESSVKGNENIFRDSQDLSLKRKMNVKGCRFDVEADMDIDDGLILDSNEESMSQGKKCKKEEGSVNTGVEEDQPMKIKTRGGKKRKKKKNQSRYYLYEKIPKPIIGRLFRPLLATEQDAPEVLAGQLADRLEEQKEDLILRVLKTIGNKKGIEVFQETKKIQAEGGMSTAYGNRKRTSGGIFLYILKSKGYATKEQLKEIFAVEREKAKQLIKEQKQRDKKLREEGIQDLKEKLAEKRKMILKAGNNESEK